MTGFIAHVYNLLLHFTNTVWHTMSSLLIIFDCHLKRSLQFYLSKVKVKVKVMLRPTVSRPVCLGIKHPCRAYDQIFVAVWHLRGCSCGALSLTRGRVCRLQLLLALASTIIFGSESRGTRDHILLSLFRDYPFRRLLRLAGLRWRYSTPPPHGFSAFWLRSKCSISAGLESSLYSLG
jgi:hypothetical protein